MTRKICIFAALVALRSNPVAVAQAPLKNMGLVADEDYIACGDNWTGSSKIDRINPPNGAKKWLPALAASLQGLKGVDGRLNSIWTSRRGRQVFAYNSTDKAATAEIDGKSVQIVPNSIYVTTDQH